MAMKTRTRLRSQRMVILHKQRPIAIERNHRRNADGDRIRSQRQCLRHIRATTDASGNHQLGLAVFSHLLQRAHRLAHRRQSRDADMLDKDILRRSRSALHAIQHNHIGARLYRQCGVIIRTRRAYLYIDGFLPVGNLAQFFDFDFQIIGTGPVGMATRTALVDTLGQVAHGSDALGNLLPHQHAAAAGLCTLPDNHLDGVSTAQVIRVHAITRRQELIDQHLRMPALLLRHAAVAGGGGCAHRRRATSESLLGVCTQRAETHPRNGNRNL